MARCGHRLAVAVLVITCLAGCQRLDWVPDPVSKPSDVTGRVWFCTPGSVDGAPGYVKSAPSTVRLEIISGAEPAPRASGRFAPGTVLGQATARPGDVWAAGSVHTVPVVWLQPDVKPADLETPAARIRVTRAAATPVEADATNNADLWAFSFFVSFDVMAVDDTGRLGIDWHLGVFSTPVVAHGGTHTAVDAAFSELRGWPHPCPPA